MLGDSNGNSSVLIFLDDGSFQYSTTASNQLQLFANCEFLYVLLEDTMTQSLWAKWKQGGIIGATSLTGGALMTITGGLVAPAIAAVFGALAPTLGTLVPVIGASGFAVVATAAGSVVGSVVVAPYFGAAGVGLSVTKMARRIGDVDEFEFKEIG